MFKQNNKFDLILIIFIPILLVSICILYLLNTTVRAHINNIEINGDINSASFNNQRLKIFFNRPMKKDKMDSDTIQISPKIKFTNTWVGNNLFIIFNESLQSSTKYEVKITKNLKDLYNSSLKDDYNYTFKTKTAQIVYISKEYGKEKTDIVKADFNFENQKIIYSDNGIKFFGLNTDFLVVVNQKGKVNDIKIINLKNNNTLILGLNDVRIDSFDFSQKENQFVYTSQEVLIRDQYTIPKPGKYNQIHLYNLNTNENIIFNPKNTAQDASEAKFSRSSNNLIYKSSDSFYYLADINKQDNYNSIGRFLSFGSFNKDESKIVFVNYDPLQTYTKDQFILEFSSDRSIKNITNGDSPVLDPTYFFNNDTIVFSQKYKELERTKGIYKLVQINSEGKLEDIYKDDNRSLELAKASYDDRYLLMERYNELDLLNFDNQREFGSQNKPGYANLVVYDLKEKKLLDKNIIGIEGSWVK